MLHDFRVDRCDDALFRSFNDNFLSVKPAHHQVKARTIAIRNQRHNDFRIDLRFEQELVHRAPKWSRRGRINRGKRGVEAHNLIESCGREWRWSLTERG